MFFSRSALLPLLAVVAVDAVASGDKPLTEEDFFTPMPTVLTASRLAQPFREAPVAMTVIDREMIEASSAIDVVELLRLVPGFQVARKEGIDTIATYHGFADDFPRRMQVLVDGRSVYDPGLNGVLWSALPITLNQIERIEVVRGSNAAAYGSNAVLGTINIISRNAATSDRFSVRAMAGTDDASAGEFSHAGVFRNGAYRLDVSRWADSGFDQRNDDSTSSIANFQGSYRPTLSDELTVRAGFRETEFDSEAYQFPNSSEREFKSNFQQFAWRRGLGTEEDLQIQVYRNAFDAPYEIDIVENGIPATVDYSLETERYDLELQHRFAPAEPWRVSWGLGMRHDKVQGGVYDTTKELDRDQFRAFGNAEWRALDRLVINAGLMAEHYSGLDTFYSPRLAANWLLDDRQTLRLSAASAYRVPTFLERRGRISAETPLPSPNDSLPLLVGSNTLDAVGSQTVDAERVDSIELGYLLALAGGSGNLDFRVFHYDIDPVIDDVKVDGPDFRQFIEAGSLDLTGFEAQAGFRPFRGNRVHLSYAYVDADGSRIEDITAGGDPIPSSKEANDDKVPRHTLTALVSQDLTNDWTISGTYSYVDEMTWMGEGEDVDSRGRLDAKLVKRIRQPGGEWVLSLTAHNLLDDEHFEFSPPDLTKTPPFPGNQVDRRVFFQAEYRLR